MRSSAYNNGREETVPTVLIAGFLAYLSLFPFNFEPQLIGSGSMLGVNTNQFFHGDFIANVIMFIPFAFCLSSLFRISNIGVGLVILTCFIGSWLLEYLQLYLPGRIASYGDMLAHFTGTLVGVVLWLLRQNIRTKFRKVWIPWFRQTNCLSRSASFFKLTLVLLFFLSLAIVSRLLIDSDQPILAEDMASQRLMSLYDAPFAEQNLNVDQTRISGLLLKIFLFVPVTFFPVVYIVSFIRRFQASLVALLSLSSILAICLVEYLQAFSAGRTVSSTDLILYAAGICIGEYLGRSFSKFLKHCNQEIPLTKLA